MNDRPPQEKRRVQPLHHDLKQRRENRQLQAQQVEGGALRPEKSKDHPTNQAKAKKKGRTNAQTKNKPPEAKVLIYRPKSPDELRNKPPKPYKKQEKQEETLLQRFVTEVIITGKILAGLLVVGAAVLVYLLFIRSNSYRIYVGDEHVATIPQGLIHADGFTDQVMAVIVSRTGSTIYLLDEISFTAANTHGESVSVDRALTTVTDTVAYLIETATFTVDGRQIVTVASQSQAEALLYQIAMATAPENAAIIDIQLNNGHVFTSFTPASDITDTETALTLLTSTQRQTQTHMVASGEALSAIADFYGISIQDILDLNPDMTPDRIHEIWVGQPLTVAVHVPLLDLTIIEQHELFETVQASVQHVTNTNLPEGATHVSQIGLPGQLRRVYTVIRRGGFEQSRDITNIEYIVPPTPYIIEIG